MLPGGPFCFGLVGVILFLVGLKTGWGALKDWRRYRESENWVSIIGLVTASNVNELSGDENTTSTYEPIITYTYQMMGNNYEGSLISFGSKDVTYNSRKKAEKVVARHPVGSQPVIYYDPADPSQAVLERKFNAANAIFGSIILLIGAWMLYRVYIQM